MSTAIDAVSSRISDIESRIASLATGHSTLRGGIMGQSIVPTPADSTGTASASQASASSDSDFTTSLAQSLQAAGIDTSALNGTNLNAANTDSTATGQAVINEAMTWVGTPYEWGGNTKEGVDCSGLVKQVLSKFGIEMPRVARDQMNEGIAVNSLDDAKTGDILVFNNGTHVGFYIGDGKMIDAPQAGDKVRVRDVYETPTQIRWVIPETSSTQAAAATSSSVSQSLSLQSSYGWGTSADLLGTSVSSRTNFDLASLANLGVSA